MGYGILGFLEPSGFGFSRYREYESRGRSKVSNTRYLCDYQTKMSVLSAAAGRSADDHQDAMA